MMTPSLLNSSFSRPVRVFLYMVIALVASNDHRGTAFGFSPALSSSSSSSSFTTTTTSSRSDVSSAAAAAVVVGNSHRRLVVALQMSEEASADENAKKKKKRREDGEAGDDAGEEQEQEEEAPQEDPEVVALKGEIAKLESSLSKTQSSIQYALDQCEEYSKTGYARKVAEMENMRRVRSNIASSSQSSATAVVLRDFLPAYDTLSALKEKYAEDAFGRSYTELTLQQTFENLGVTNYNVEAGEAVNTFRMKVLESEMSKDYPKDTVIRQVSAGLELDGNVIRAASCVASLGAEEEKKEADAAGSTDGGSEDAAGETE